MFSQASVILFTGDVWQTPPSRHPPGQTPPRADTPWVGTPQGRHTPPGQTPPKIATAGDGTHHTGMHSCLPLSF